MAEELRAHNTQDENSIGYPSQELHHVTAIICPSQENSGNSQSDALLV